MIEKDNDQVNLKSSFQKRLELIHQPGFQVVDHNKELNQLKKQAKIKEIA